MRKIKYKIAAVIATAIMMFTTVMEPIVPVFAAGITVTTKTGKIALSDGTYHVNISILKETTDAASAAAGYIDRDQVAFEVKGGIGKLKISYTTTMIGNLHQVIDGNKEVLTVVEDGEKKSVELTFTSLDEATYLGMNIDTGIIGVLPQTARVVLDQGSLTKDGVNVSPVPTATPDATTSPSVVPTATPDATTSPSVVPTATPDATTSPSVVPTATPDVTTSPSVMPTTAPSTGKVELADGTYSISYSVLKETADSTSNAGAYFDKENAVLTVKNKVAKLRVAYSDSMIGNLQQVVGDNKEVLTVVEHGAKKYVEVTLNSLSEVGYLYMEIDTNTSFGVMKHVVRLVLDETTLKKDGVIVPGGTTTPSPAPTATAKPTESPTNKPEQDNTQGLKDGVYETNAYLWHATSDQASMAGNAMESVVRVSVKNGKSTMYIYTREMSMGTIKAFLQELKVLSADGTYKNAKVEAYDSNKNPICFSFEIPAYTEYINVKVNPMVALMGNQDIDARIKFDYQAMKTVSGTVDLTQSPSSSTNQQPTTKPNATTKPTATVKPNATTKPTATVKPNATTKPTATVKPNTTVKPSTTTKPETNSGTSNDLTSGTTNNSTNSSTNNSTTEESINDTTDVTNEETVETLETEQETTEDEVPEETAAPEATEQPEATKATEEQTAQPSNTVKESSTSTLLMIAAAACAALFAGVIGVTVKGRTKKGKSEEK